jgi:hypothetical protein
MYEKFFAFCWAECCELVSDNAQNEQYKTFKSIGKDQALLYALILAV